VTHLGLDASGYQFPDDFGTALDALRAQGGDTPFIFLKTDPENPDAATQIAELDAAAKARGAGAGGYVYIDWGRAVQPQMQWAIDNTPSHWPIFADLEDMPDNTPGGAVLAVVDIACQTVAATGRHTGNYTNCSWYQGEGDPTTWPLWLAQPSASTPAYPCLIWQSSFSGSIPGISGTPDLDQWMGNGPKAVSFEAFFGLDPQPQPDPSGGDMAVPVFEATITTDPTGGGALWCVKAQSRTKFAFTTDAHANSYVALGVPTTNLTALMSSAEAIDLFNDCQTGTSF
jgi:GH25 family lysozyme M1 (1,4-beta-N-acetylmuramidase)